MRCLNLPFLLLSACLYATDVAPEQAGDCGDACVLIDTSVDVLPINICFLESCSWWRCKETETGVKTGPGCGSFCSDQNSTLLAESCLKNEYVEPCAVPYDASCRTCRFGENYKFFFDEGSLVLPAPALAEEWTSDILKGVGGFENAKISELDKWQGFKTALSQMYMPSGEAQQFDDVLFMPLHQDTRDETNTWYGRGLLRLMFTSPTDARGLGALDSRTYLQMVMGGSQVDLYHAVPYVYLEDPQPGAESTDKIRNFKVELHWSVSVNSIQVVEFAIALYNSPDGSIPPTNTSSLMFQHIFTRQTTRQSVGWREESVVFPVPESSIPDKYVLKVSVTARYDVYLDEIRVVPLLLSGGTFEDTDNNDPDSGTISHAFSDEGLDTQSGVRNYSDFAVGVGVNRVNGRFNPGNKFLFLQGSNKTTEYASATRITLVKPFNHLFGTWITMRVWVMPVQDPTSDEMFRETNFNIKLLIDNDHSQSTSAFVVKKTVTLWDWQLYEVTFPALSQHHTSDDFVQINVISGSALAVDNLEVFVGSGVCPFECSIELNMVRLNGRCEKCVSNTDTTTCNKNQKTMGCEVTETDNINLCEECKDHGGPTLTANGDYELSSTHGECWFVCSPEYWYNEEILQCVPCSAATDFLCGTGEYVRACAPREDTMCALCTTVSDTQGAAVVFTGGLSTSAERLRMDEQEQCSAACAPGYFQWLRQDQQYAGGVHNPLCFPCTESICGADGLSGTTRSGLGMQYTSTCSATEDSKCKSCDAEMEHMQDKTVLVANGGRIGEFCAYKCSPGYKVCEECRFHGETGYPLEVITDADVQQTNNWKYVNTTDNAVVSLFHLQDVGQGAAQQTELENAYRISGSVMFETWPYATQLSVCLTLNDEASGFEMLPLNGSCVLVVRPQVALSRELWNQSFSVEVAIFEMFTNIPTAVAVHKQDTGNSVSYENLQMRWTVTVQAKDEQVAVQLFSLKVERYHMKTGCCITPHSCQACNVSALGQHEHFVQSAFTAVQECQVTCDTHYEDYTDNGTCLLCVTPECVKGEYFSDCGQCAPCVAKPPNAAWVDTTTVRGDNASCAFECNDAFWQARDFVGKLSCAACSVLDCANVSVTTDLQHYEVPCSSTTDTRCASCTFCEPGLYVESACNNSTNTVCEQCAGGLPVGAVWVVECIFQCLFPLIHNTLTRTCQSCDTPCAVGNYSTRICDLSNNFTGCQACYIPRNAVATSVGILYETSCQWQCNVGYFYDAVVKKCVLFIPEPVVPVVLCNDTLCALGEYQDSESCLCVLCSTQRGNHTMSPTISLWETGAVCSWYCKYPYMRQGDLCFNVENIRVQATSKATSKSTSSKARINAYVSKAPSRSVMLSIVFSVIPIVVMTLIVSVTVAL